MPVPSFYDSWPTAPSYVTLPLSILIPATRVCWLVTEYKDSPWNKSSVWLYYIDYWTRLNQFGIFEEQENNVVMNEKSVEGKPCINRESNSNDLTI